MPQSSCSGVEGLPQMPCHSPSKWGEGSKGGRELSGSPAGDPAVPRQPRLREVKGLA